MGYPNSYPKKPAPPPLSMEAFAALTRAIGPTTDSGRYFVVSPDTANAIRKVQNAGAFQIEGKSGNFGTVLGRRVIVHGKNRLSV